MIDRTEILRLANEFGLEARIVEKDYILGWLLAGIYRDPLLAAAWVFKGGTCLKKCFFETYRFSRSIPLMRPKGAARTGRPTSGLWSIEDSLPL